MKTGKLHTPILSRGVFLALLWLVTTSGRPLSITPEPQTEFAIVVDAGIGTSSPLNDVVHYGTGASMELPDYVGEGEITLYPNDSTLAPTLIENIDWSSTEPLTIDANRSVKVAGRIVLLYRPDTVTSEEAIGRLRYAVNVANALYASNRTGFALDVPEVEIIDCSGLPGAAGYAEFGSCEKQLELYNDTSLDPQMQPRPGVVNVYVTRTVNMSTGMGNVCYGKGFIALSYDARFDLLAHELGHQLGLEQPEGLGYGNVMLEYPTEERAELTEGQVFCMAFSESSLANYTAFGASLLYPVTRDCYTNGWRAQMPTLMMSLWPHSASTAEAGAR